MFLHAEKSEAESSVGRVAELEAALREEKDRHQTEMLTLQEEFARRKPMAAVAEEGGDEELQERWKRCENDEEREGCFKTAMRKAEAAEERAREAIQ